MCVYRDKCKLKVHILQIKSELFFHFLKNRIIKMEKMAINERLRAVIDFLEEKRQIKNQSDFALILGKRKSVISEMLSGNRVISERFVHSVSGAFPVINPDWLWTGNGEMEKKSYEINQKHSGVPYYDVDFINGFDLVLNDQSVNPAYHIDFPQYNNADCWVNATGDSMKPLINHGDIVALRQIEDWQTYMLFGEIYAVVTNEYRTIKRVRKSTKGEEFLRFVPLNTSEFDEQDIPVTTIRSVFQVIGCAKKIF